MPEGLGKLHLYQNRRTKC